MKKQNNIKNEVVLSIMYKISGVVMFGIILFQFIIRNISIIIADISFNTITTIDIINFIIQILIIPIFILTGITMWGLGIEIERKRKNNKKRG